MKTQRRNWLHRNGRVQVSSSGTYDREYARYGMHIAYVMKIPETRSAANRKSLPPTLLVLALMVVLSIAVSSRMGETSVSFPHGSGVSFPDGSGVLIVDELGPEGQPMPSSTTDLIKTSGTPEVYVSGLSVDQFSSLASLHYRLILLRVHSGPDSVAMVEEYSYWTHVYGQLNNDVGAMRLAEGKIVFTVTPGFLRDEMRGNFEHSPIVIVEGCAALSDAELAQAFIGRGAGAFIGWDRTVTLYHADLVTGRVLEKLLVKNETLGNSVLESMREVGPDPLSGASLSYYPSSASSVSYGNS